jgi:hypothetical protein
MSYSWLKFFHVAAVLALLGTQQGLRLAVYRLEPAARAERIAVR